MEQDHTDEKLIFTGITGIFGMQSKLTKYPGMDGSSLLDGQPLPH
jgi:hypothetical protein